MSEENAPMEVEATKPLPRVRFVPITDNLELVEELVNDLISQGYALNAIAGKYVMLQIPEENPMLGAIERLAELQKDLPPMPEGYGGQSFDPNAGGGFGG